MLKLQNVCKTYKTKAKAETQALKNVNLELSSRGMVFVLGKSGSGKSTLLNLLGGLDSPTSGEIFVDGKSMASFTPSDYADYRNDYVGFIFQEFNLLSDLNVKDNVALALQLTKSENIADKVSDALKRVELTDDYLTRRIDEMSGGEKQRIAIARALIKQSKMILADEPTGNLDSQTGESIWNILKSLSTERLVVVVSHDRESAEKYADRIIEIADGEIISDTGTQPSEASQPSDTPQSASAPPQVSQSSAKKAKHKNRLSFATCLKMGFNNLRLRKAKTISVILVAVFCILSIVFTEMALTFSPEAALAKYMQEYNVEYFSVTQGEGSNIGYNSPKEITSAEAKQYIAENCQYIEDGIVESKQDILDFGLIFVGEALELNDNFYYVNSFALEEAYKNKIMVKIDGGTVELDKTRHPVEYLVGKKVEMYGMISNCVLAGVIDVSDLFDSSYAMSDSPFPRYFHNKNTEMSAPLPLARMLIRTSSVKNLSKFVRTLRRDYNCGIAYAGFVDTTSSGTRGHSIEIARIAYMFEGTMHMISFILLILGAILLIILILLVVNLVSFSITNRKREIGILSAIGASNKDITGIFLLETGIIAALVFVLGFIASFIIAFVTNTMESNLYTLNIALPFLRVNILTIVTLVVASFGLLLLAALIPLRRVIKQKPVDAIRHI